MIFMATGVLLIIFVAVTANLTTALTDLSIVSFAVHNDYALFASSSVKVH